MPLSYCYFEAPVGHPDRAGRRLLGACSFFRSSLIYLFIIVFIYYGPTQPQEPSPKLLVVWGARGQPQAIPDRSRGRTRLYAKKKRRQHTIRGPFSLKTAPRAAPFASDMLFTDADLFRCQAGPKHSDAPQAVHQLSVTTVKPAAVGRQPVRLGTDLPQYS